MFSCGGEWSNNPRYCQQQRFEDQPIRLEYDERIVVYFYVCMISQTELQLQK